MDRIYTYVTTVLLTFFWATSSLAQSERDWYGWGHPAWGWGHMIFGGVMMVVFWGGIILLIVLLVRWIGGSGISGGGPAGGPTTPLDILQERFAKGEIDKKEYEERRKLLSD